MSDSSHYYHEFEEDRNYIRDAITGDPRTASLADMYISLVKLKSEEPFRLNHFSLIQNIETDIIVLIENLIDVSPTTKCSVKQYLDELY